MTSYTDTDVSDYPAMWPKLKIKHINKQFKVVLELLRASHLIIVVVEWHALSCLKLTSRQSGSILQRAWINANKVETAVGFQRLEIRYGFTFFTTCCNSPFSCTSYDILQLSCYSSFSILIHTSGPHQSSHIPVAR